MKSHWELFFDVRLGCNRLNPWITITIKNGKSTPCACISNKYAVKPMKIHGQKRAEHKYN